MGDSVWQPLAPPARQHDAGTGSAVLETAAETLVEMLSALARRQHEHRERTADRLAVVARTGLLPVELHEMTVYYLAKAQRDLGRSDDSRQGMQQVAEGGGRFAPAARPGLAHLARLAGDFPAALDTARQPGWEGRDAGTTTADLEDRAHLLRAQAQLAGLVSAQVTLKLAVCFHHAVLDNPAELTTTTSRLDDLTRNGDYAYYTDIAHFMADRPLPVEPVPRVRWLDGEEPTRHRRRALVTARRAIL